MLQNPIFDEREMEREKGVIIEEINMYKDSRQIHVESLFDETLWRDQHLGRDIAGSAEVIRSIKRPDILDFRNSFYQPSNMIIAISGNFNQKLLEDLVEEHWTGVPNKKASGFKAVYENPSVPRLSLENTATQQPHMTPAFCP